MCMCVCVCEKKLINSSCKLKITLAGGYGRGLDQPNLLARPVRVGVNFVQEELGELSMTVLSQGMCV